MNKTVLSLPLALAIAVLTLVSIGCSRSPDTNVNPLTTNRNSTLEPINTASIEAEIMKMERDWSAAAKNKDTEAVRRILADDVVLTYPDGTAGTKNDEIQLVESGAITADSWETLDSKVTVLDADAAFITGRSVVKNGKLKHPRTQQMVDISGEYRFLDIFAKRNGRWQVVASQATGIQKQP
jgi:ketosteroid isomerase-like protein